MWRTALRLGMAFASVFCSAAHLEVKQEPGAMEVVCKDSTKWVYVYEDVPYKPYIKELRTPSGLNVLLDSPPDHKHHHGLMLALGVDQVDFWGEHDPNQVGTQSTVAIESISENGKKSGGHAGLVCRLNWKAPDGSVLLEETRSIRTFLTQEDPVTLLTWQSDLSVPESASSTTLWGRHYFGLGMRFLPGMNGALFFNADAREEDVVRGSEKLVYSRWCACRAQVDGKPVTVAMFDHPLNPRYPARWFTMNDPFSYLSATLNLEAQPGAVNAERPLSLRYGVALWDGHKVPEGIEAMYQTWLSLENPMKEGINVARDSAGASAFASSEYGPEYVAGKAIDGRYTVRETDKWNSKENITPHYVRVDLGQPRTIDCVVVRHEGVIVGGDAFRWNTQDFRVQGSKSPWGPWKDLVVPVYRNTDNVTIHRFEPVKVRFVRILIETGEQQNGNAYGRIPEVEIYSQREG